MTTPSWASTPVGAGTATASERFGLPEQGIGEGERVDADVGQAATPQVRIEPAPLRVLIGGIAEVGLQVADLADRSVADQCLHSVQEGKEAHPHGLHEEHTGAAGSCHHLHRLGMVECQRLLAQHRQPGLETDEGVGMVLVVGGSHVHRVDPAGDDQVLVCAVPAGDAVPCGEGGGALLRARRDRHHLAIGDVGDGLGQLPGHASGTEDAPADDFHDPHPTAPGAAGSNVGTGAFGPGRECPAAVS